MRLLKALKWQIEAFPASRILSTSVGRSRLSKTVSKMERTPLRLPKLKIKNELLRTAPELGRLLAAAGEGDAGTAAAPASRAPSPLKPRPRSSPSKRAISPGRLVRRFTDDEMTEEEQVVGAGF
jgi:hypothetical protein